MYLYLQKIALILTIVLAVLTTVTGIFWVATLWFGILVRFPWLQLV